MTFPFDSAWAGSVFSSSPSSSTQSLPATPYGYLPCSSFSLTPIFGMGAPRMGAGLHFNFPSPGFPPPACDWTGNFPAQTPFPGQSPFLHGQPPLAFTKGDTEGVNALLRRSKAFCSSIFALAIILYMKLDNGTSNWTFSYHDQTMRNFLTCTFRVLPTQIVCSKIVSSEGFVFGTFVLQSEKLAQDLVHNFNSAPVQSCKHSMVLPSWRRLFQTCG